MHRFSESLVTDRLPGANGQLGNGLAAEVVVRNWLAYTDEAAEYRQGQMIRAARVAEDRAIAERLAGRHSAEVDAAVLVAAGHAVLFRQVEVPNT